MLSDDGPAHIDLGGGQPLRLKKLRAMRAQGGIKCFVLDMDGVIFERHNAWLDVVRAYHAEQEAMEIVNRHLKTNYELMARQIAERLLKGRPVDRFNEVMRDRRLSPGVQDLFEYLHKRDIFTIIVSTGPKVLAERVQKEFGVDEILANDIAVRDGHFTGDVDIQVIERRKSASLEPVLEAAAQRRKFVSLNVAGIGDSEADRGILAKAALGFAYGDRSRELRQVAQVHIPIGQLGRIPDIVDELGL